MPMRAVLPRLPLPHESWRLRIRPATPTCPRVQPTRPLRTTRPSARPTLCRPRQLYSQFLRPKCHNALQPVDQLDRVACNLNCFVLERKHSFVRRLANFQFREFDRGTACDVLNTTVESAAAMMDAVLGDTLVNGTPAPWALQALQALDSTIDEVAASTMLGRASDKLVVPRGPRSYIRPQLHPPFDVPSLHAPMARHASPERPT